MSNLYSSFGFSRTITAKILCILVIACIIKFKFTEGVLRTKYSNKDYQSPSDGFRNSSLQCFDLAVSYCADDFYTFNFESLGDCLHEHGPEIEVGCATPLMETQATITIACAVDIYSLCSEDIANPIKSDFCLLSNYPSLTTRCRSEVDSMVDIWLPCFRDADTYCRDQESVDEMLDCLSAVPGKDLSGRCQATLPSYLACRSQVEKKPPTHTPLSHPYSSVLGSLFEGFNQVLPLQEGSRGNKDKDHNQPSKPDKKPCWDLSDHGTGTGGGDGQTQDNAHNSDSTESSQQEVQPHGGIPPPILIGLFIITAMIAWYIYKKPAEARSFYNTCHLWFRQNVYDRVFPPITRPSYRNYERTAAAEEESDTMLSDSSQHHPTTGNDADIEMTSSTQPAAVIERGHADAHQSVDK